MNKKEDKFKFVTNEDTLDTINSNETSDLDNVNIIDTPEEVTIESNKLVLEDNYSSNNKQYNDDIKGKFHISFELRVILMIILILT